MSTYVLPGRRVESHKMKQRRNQEKHLRRQKAKGHRKSPAPARKPVGTIGERKAAAMLPETPKPNQQKSAATWHEMSTPAPAGNELRPSATVTTAPGNAPNAKPVPIEELDLVVRTFNLLKREGINDIDALTARTEGGLLDIRNFGQKSIDEVKQKLAGMDLTLKGDTLPDTEPT